MDTLADSLHHEITKFIGKNNYLNMHINKQYTNIYKELYGPNTSVKFLLKDGNIPLIKYNIKTLKSLKPKTQKTLSLKVLKYDNIELIKLCHENKLLFHKDSLKTIASIGNLEAFEYLYDRINIKKNKNIFDNAALNGHLECLKFLHLKECPWGSKTTYNAAISNHTECFKFLLENDCPTDNSILANCIKNNDLVSFKYYHMYGFKLTGDLCYTAVVNKNLECLKYCFENGCKFNKSICNTALDHKSFDCLRFCYNNGAEWIYSRHYITTEEIYMEFIKYSLKYNKLLNENICNDVSKLGYLKCLKYLLSDDKEYKFHKDQKLLANDICINAIQYNHFAILKYSIENSLFHPVMINNGVLTETAALKGNLSCLKYLYDNNFVITEKAATNAIMSDKVNCLEYIYEVEKNTINWKNCYTVATYGFGKKCIFFLEDKLELEKTTDFKHNIFTDTNGCTYDFNSLLRIIQYMREIQND